MGARFGPDNVNSGPRLPRNRFTEPSYDPSKGGCFNCGDKVGVMEFHLVREGRPAGRWRLCGPCYEWGNVRDPRDADPLTAA